MKQSTLELWVGLFVALGIAALVFLSLQVAGSNATLQGGKTYTVYADFGDIGGLKTKAPVKVSGVVVGRVSAIELNPETYRAKVAIDLADAYRFSSDVSAQILTSGILGEQYIGLQEGGDMDQLQAGDTITLTSSALVLENLIGKFMTGFAEKNAEPQQ
ncbi:MAG: outer membrane lipid asymmetry maintenance protein MlaD [Neisseria sp.]|nr:outer membrane lipid asymmetry maintenance protein MlaD [Neisseria sp.]